MMARRLTTLTALLLLLGCARGAAQRKVMVMDMETMMPIAGANVTTNGRNVTTDSLGWCSVGDSCRTLVVSHVSYESSIVNIKAAGKDTVYLLSRYMMLPEVTVLGQGKGRDYSDLQKSLRLDKVEAQLAAADPNGGLKISLGSLAKLLPKKWRPGYKKEQRKKRLKEILENY
ncbi:MAG: carboxypeptidase-like regulatory domain-containing protein [Prevotella sp.]|nr:carboxypeptidase-like regulatory domain-containing protein [Prevotella sp.]